MRCRDLLALITGLLVLPGLLMAVNPELPNEPGMRVKPRKELTSPKRDGIVMAPPKVDRDALKTPPKNIDPDINAATKPVDQHEQKHTHAKPPKK